MLPLLVGPTWATEGLRCAMILYYLYRTVEVDVSQLYLLNEIKSNYILTSNSYIIQLYAHQSSHALCPAATPPI